MASFDISSISRTYNSRLGRGVAALRDLSLNLHQRQVTALLGPSGCGKTTLLNILAGLDQQDSGTISVDGGPYVPDRIRIGYLFQTPSLIPWRSVLQNAVLGAEVLGEARDTRESRARTLLMRYGLGEFLSSYPSMLSMGMQQRVALIRLVLYGSDLLLLDEPFNSLDYWIRRELQRDIASITEENAMTTVMVTHDIGEALTLADRIYVLSSRPAHVVANYEIGIPRSERLSADPGATGSLSSVFGDIWRNLQAAYVETEVTA